MTRLTWKQKHIDFVNSIYKQNKAKDVTKMFNDKFGTDLSVSAVSKKIRYLKGLNGSYKNESERNVNNKPIGTIRKGLNGYLEIKIKNIKYNGDKNWKKYHEYIWEKENGKTIPEKYKVIFLNDNKRDCRIENLRLTTRHVYRVMISKKLFSNDPKETIKGIKEAETFIKSKKPKRTSFNWEKKHIDFLKKHAKGSNTKEITKKFNDHFNTNNSDMSVRTQVYNHNLKFDNHPGRFKKGNIPPGEYKIGDKAIDGDGGVIIKIANDHHNYKRNWKKYHIYLWEKYKGTVPEEHLVIFLNNDNRDFRLENLELVPRSIYQMMILNDLVYDDPELTKTGINIAKLLKKQTKNSVKEMKRR